VWTSSICTRLLYVVFFFCPLVALMPGRDHSGLELTTALFCLAYQTSADYLMHPQERNLHGMVFGVISSPFLSRPSPPPPTSPLS
jgi:hypothetical protein